MKFEEKIYNIDNLDNKDIDEKLISETKELSGLGVIAKVEEKEILIGNDKLMKENNIDYKRL